MCRKTPARFNNKSMYYRIKIDQKALNLIVLAFLVVAINHKSFHVAATKIIFFFKKRNKWENIKSLKGSAHERSASAPPVISRISLVMAACRALLYCKVSSPSRSVALSVAWCMAVMRAPCSAAQESSKVL